MLFNVGIDIVIGCVPFLGDLADVFWKSNSRNMALLERHATVARPAAAGDWLFVASLVAAVLAIAIIPLLAVYWLSSVVGRTIWS